MVKISKIKITVLKKFKPGEVFKKTPADSNIKDDCSLFTVGQEFIIDDNSVVGKIPEGFCTWAWNDLFGVLTHLRLGGDFPWMNEEGVTVACCTDGFRPVIFKLERIK